MNKNIENYKKAIDQIKVDENLKEKVLENTKDKKVSKKPIYYLRYAVSLAAVTFVTIVGLNFYNIPKEKNLKINKNIEIDGEEILAESNIKRFKNIEELRDILEELEENSFNSFNFYDGIKQSTKSATTESEGIMLEDTTTNSDGMTNSSSNSLNYSKTNNQVENVDEADIVKTDGKYIYYCKKSKSYILDDD